MYHKPLRSARLKDNSLLAYSQLAHSSWVQIPILIKEKNTSEMRCFLRAGDGIRTHDINLGKVALYH